MPVSCRNCVSGGPPQVSRADRFINVPPKRRRIDFCCATFLSFCLSAGKSGRNARFSNLCGKSHPEKDCNEVHSRVHYRYRSLSASGLHFPLANTFIECGFAGHAPPRAQLTVCIAIEIWGSNRAERLLGLPESNGMCVHSHASKTCHVLHRTQESS